MKRKTKNKFHIKLDFNLHEMPKSLNTSSFVVPTLPTKSLSTIKRHRRTTKQMVNDALTKLHSAKGTTLRRLHNYIKSELTEGSLSKQRMSQIKKYLNELRESNRLFFVNDKGFVGHFKLIDKRKFSKTLKDGKAAKEESKQKIENRNVKKKLVASVKPTRQVNRLGSQNFSIFDTPMITGQVDASSTPFLTNLFVPQAPEITKKLPRKRAINSQNIETPRSSLTKKKRRLHKLPE